MTVSPATIGGALVLPGPAPADPERSRAMFLEQIKGVSTTAWVSEGDIKSVLQRTARVPSNDRAMLAAVLAGHVSAGLIQARVAENGACEYKANPDPPPLQEMRPGTPAYNAALARQAESERRAFERESGRYTNHEAKDQRQFVRAIVREEVRSTVIDVLSELGVLDEDATTQEKTA